MWDSCRTHARKNAKFLSYILEGELAQWQSTHLLIQRSPVQFPTRSQIGVIDYDEACIMHLTPGVVHNFPKAVGVWDFCPLCTKRSQIPI